MEHSFDVTILVINTEVHSYTWEYGYYQAFTQLIYPELLQCKWFDDGSVPWNVIHKFHDPLNLFK